MIKKIVCIFVSLWLAGCATTPKILPLDTTGLGLKGKSLVLVKRNSPDFIAMTSGKGMFAVVGVGAAIITGNKLVKEKNIVDPALDISQSLSKVLTSRYGLGTTEITRKTADEDDLNTIIALAAGKDYVLDVVTNGWNFIYDGFDFSHYLVGYSARLRFIDVKTAKVLATGQCIYDWKKAGKALVSYEQLLAHDAAVIKSYLAESVDHCTDHYVTTLFNNNT